MILNDVERLVPGRGVSVLLEYLVNENKRLNKTVESLAKQVSMLTSEEQETLSRERKKYNIFI